MGKANKPKPAETPVPTPQKPNVLPMLARLVYEIKDLKFYKKDTQGNYQLITGQLPKNIPIYVAGTMLPNGCGVAAVTTVTGGNPSNDITPSGTPPQGTNFVIPLGSFPNNTGNPLNLAVRVRITNPPIPGGSSSITEDIEP